jgi:hypothetical protein
MAVRAVHASLRRRIYWHSLFALATYSIYLALILVGLYLITNIFKRGAVWVAPTAGITARRCAASIWEISCQVFSTRIRNSIKNSSSAMPPRVRRWCLSSPFTPCIGSPGRAGFWFQSTCSSSWRISPFSCQRSVRSVVTTRPALGGRRGCVAVPIYE